MPKRRSIIFSGMAILLVAVLSCKTSSQRPLAQKALAHGQHKEVKRIGDMEFVYIKGGEFLMGSPDGAGGVRGPDGEEPEFLQGRRPNAC